MNDALYQQAIVDAARAAVGAGRLAGADGEAELDNPLCGDRVRIGVSLDHGAVRAVAQEVRGCLLCEAAASLIAGRTVGLPVADAMTLRAGVDALLREGAPPPAGWEVLRMFTPVAARPSRHECVLLPFEALRVALRAALESTATGRPA